MPKKSKKPKTSKSALFKKIQRCIDERIRPYIQMHGGEIELVKLTKKNELRVRLCGACQGCGLANYTLQNGVQEALNQEFPEENILVVPAE